MFKNSIVLNNYSATYQRSDAIPGGFTRTVGSIPNWLEHYRSYMTFIGFDSKHWDENDWREELWATDQQLDPRNSPLWFALHAVAGYKSVSQTQIARNRPFVNKPLDADQIKMVHPLLRDSLPALINVSQSLWENRQACYFMVAEQEKEDGVWEHPQTFYVDSPWGVYLMAKLEKIKQYKMQGSNLLIDELVNYPKKRGPRPNVIRAQQKAEVLARYDRWLDLCAEVREKRQVIEQEIKELTKRKRELQAQLSTIKAPPFVK